MGGGGVGVCRVGLVGWVVVGVGVIRWVVVGWG